MYLVSFCLFGLFLKRLLGLLPLLAQNPHRNASTNHLPSLGREPLQHQVFRVCLLILFMFLYLLKDPYELLFNGCSLSCKRVDYFVATNFVFRPSLCRELSFLEVNSPLPYLTCKWRHHHSSLGFGWLRSPYEWRASSIVHFLCFSFLLFLLSFCSLSVVISVCVLSLNPTLFFHS